MTASPLESSFLDPVDGEGAAAGIDPVAPVDPLSPSETDALPPAVQAELTALRQEVDRLQKSMSPQVTLGEHLSTSQLAIALERDEEFIRALLSNLSEAIVACDAQGQLMVYNAAARRLLHLPPTPTPQLQWNQHCSFYGPSQDQPLAPAADPLWRAYQGESVQDFEMDIHPPTGPRRRVLVNGDPIISSSGRTLGAVVALRDITPFRQATATLQEREMFLRSIYNGLKASIFVVDVCADGAFRYVGINPAHEQRTGVTAHSIQGKTPQQVLPPEIAAAVCDRYRECVEAQAPLSYEEMLPFQEGGNWWLTTLTPLVGDQGSIYRLIGTSINISRRRQAEARIQQLNTELEERVAERTQELTRINTMLLQTTALLEKRNHELDQFVYVASHDLKAPLRAIANLSSWLEEDLADALPAENRDQLQLLRGRVNRMEALINGLLDYSRIGRKEFPLETVATGAMVAEVVDSLAPPEGFTVEIPPDMPVLWTKGLLLQQVFANLISNAIKYVDRPDGRITITWAEVGNQYRFSVADNGPGIDRRYHDKVFAVFQTLQARDQVESTGIGLALIKKIVEGEKGTITLESEVGAGATFHFTWPRSSPGAPPPVANMPDSI